MIMFLSNPVLFTRDPSEYYQTLNWLPGDSESKYKKNLKIHTEYLSQSCFQNIEYSINEFGYRADSFDSVNWNESIIMFGCSMCFGKGLKYEHTTAGQLSTIINTPVINLGVNGGSPYIQQINTILLLTYLKKINAYPRAAIYMWPSLNRTPAFNKNETTFQNLGPWMYRPELSFSDYHLQLFDILAINDNMQVQNEFSIHTCNNLLWDDIPVVYNSYFRSTAEFLNQAVFPITDNARDMVHPGPITANACAEYFANQLNLSS